MSETAVDKNQEEFLAALDETDKSVDEETKEESDEKEDKERATREYIILESKQTGVWQEKEKVTAATNDDALEAIKDPQATSKYQAIASRNWSPKSPKVETVTVVRFE